jgi:hypothetical protein
VIKPLTFFFSLVFLSATLESGRADPRFIQDRFAIGFWVAPQTDDNIDARYAEIADANFTFVMGLCGASSPAPVDRQLELCAKHGLVALISEGGLPADKLPTGPALWGYMLVDEPNASQFPDLRKKVDAIHEARPGKLAYINLFPNYANAGQLGTATYDEHVTRFMQEVRPDVLSMDHYPRFNRNRDGRDNYCTNLAVMRREALASGIPFWNYFNTMPYGPHTDPTEAQLRWQIFTSLAYGAKGIMYFCYWTPRGEEFPKGGAVLTADGHRTRHYDEARRINAGIKNLGPTLMKLTSTGIYRVKPGQNAADILKETPIHSLSDGDFLVGTFTLPDGRRAVLVNNYDITYAEWPTIAFDAESTKVLEVSPKTGEANLVVDDSPDMPGLQVSLDAGQGRLFILPGK